MPFGICYLLHFSKIQQKTAKIMHFTRLLVTKRLEMSLKLFLY